MSKARNADSVFVIQFFGLFELINSLNGYIWNK